jgi:hypothetical protein
MDFVVRASLSLLEFNLILISLIVAIIIAFNDNDKNQG